uniref:Uncharacterized protein n=1 Tax=viral metagenome TaxID=1070528 RepID=A0A6H1ZLU2_9ZZZZ
MTCIVGKGIVICGDFAPPDGKWHDMGYLGIMHKCHFCSLAARFISREEGRRDIHWCGRCQIKEPSS